MRDTPSLDAVTHNDCVLGATFVKSPANSLDAAGSVGRSAPPEPVRFLRYDLLSLLLDIVGPAPWTLVWPTAVITSCLWTWCVARDTTLVSVVSDLLTAMASCRSLVVVWRARFLALNITEVHRLGTSGFLSSRWTISERSSPILSQAIVFLFRIRYCLA